METKRLPASVHSLFTYESAPRHAESKMWIRKISYPHFGDNSGDNPLSYPHTGDNLWDSLGITFRAHNRCLRNAVRRDMRERAHRLFRRQSHQFRRYYTPRWLRHPACRRKHKRSNGPKPTPAPTKNRRMMALALPTFGQLIAEPTFILIDTAIVGHIGDAALAGLSIGSTIILTAVGLCIFLAYAKNHCAGGTSAGSGSSSRGTAGRH